jgi:hypothetical protein
MKDANTAISPTSSEITIAPCRDKVVDDLALCFKKNEDDAPPPGTFVARSPRRIQALRRDFSKPRAGAAGVTDERRYSPRSEARPRDLFASSGVRKRFTNVRQTSSLRAAA